MNDSLRYEAIERGLSAKLEVEEAKADLQRYRLIHEQNLRAAQAISRSELARSHTRVIESKYRIREAEARGEATKADEKVWSLRAAASRGTNVPLLEIAETQAKYWEARYQVAVEARARAQAIHDYVADEFARTRRLYSQNAVSREEYIEMEGQHNQAVAQLTIAGERVESADRARKESTISAEQIRTH